jgi:uncharacterized repeat protein (TIGR01451 family)
VIANGIASAPLSFTAGGGGGGGGTSPGNGSGSADLVVTESGPATANEGDTLTYTLNVTNTGPNDATSTVLTDTIGTNLQFASATMNQGTYSQSGGVVTISLGTVSSGQTLVATVTVSAVEDGSVTTTASVSSGVTDPNPSNNTASVTTSIAEPAITMSGPITLSGKRFNNVNVATFTHANGVEPASAFTATINWGDGTSSTGSVNKSGTTYNVRGSHNYRTNGSYTVTTTVTETDQPRHAEPQGPIRPPGLGGGSLGQGSSLASSSSSSQPGASAILGTTAGMDTGQDVVVVSLGLGGNGKGKTNVPQGPRAFGFF